VQCYSENVQRYAHPPPPPKSPSGPRHVGSASRAGPSVRSNANTRFAGECRSARGTYFRALRMRRGRMSTQIFHPATLTPSFPGNTLAPGRGRRGGFVRRLGRLRRDGCPRPNRRWPRGVGRRGGGRSLWLGRRWMCRLQLMDDQRGLRRRRWLRRCYGTGRGIFRHDLRRCGGGRWRSTTARGELDFIDPTQCICQMIARGLRSVW